MIKDYQSSWSSIKNFVKLVSHCYHNDQAVKMGELRIFLEAPISEEKATDIFVDTSQKLYAITQDKTYEVDDYDLERFKKNNWESDEDGAVRRRFNSVIDSIVYLFLYERSEEWMAHNVGIRDKYDYERREWVSRNELVFELWCKDIENIDVKAELDKVLQKYNVDSNVSTSFKLKNIKYSYTSAGEERYEKDLLGNIPEPGDTVILLDKGADIFVGFNKASWSCLKNYGYGYVVKKHPVNTNGGEPLKAPEDFNVSA